MSNWDTKWAPRWLSAHGEDRSVGPRAAIATANNAVRDRDNRFTSRRMLPLACGLYLVASRFPAGRVFYSAATGDVEDCRVGNGGRCDRPTRRLAS